MNGYLGGAFLIPAAIKYWSVAETLNIAGAHRSAGFSKMKCVRIVMLHNIPVIFFYYYFEFCEDETGVYVLSLDHLFQDGNGYIDEQELDALLQDLYQKNKKVRCELGQII